MIKSLLVASLLAGCFTTIPTAYYVSAVRPGPGGLVEVERCGLDDQGQPLSSCYSQMVAARSPAAVAAQQATEMAPLPQPAPKVERGPGSPPTLAEALAVVNQSDDVHAAVEACRGQYAKSLARLRVSVTIAPDGSVVSVEPRGKLDWLFTECSARALRGATFPSYSGAPEQYDLMILL
jgi:hypothetical protein